MNKKIVIVDYDIGNIKSIINAFKHHNVELILSSNKDDILSADAVVLPGVGAFSHGMENLEKKGLVDVLKEYASKDKPFLGICLGMQLLFSKSYEFLETKGLDIISGTVEIITKDDNTKLPHISWNEIFTDNINLWENTIFNNIQNSSNVYFVHSYVCLPKDDSLVLSYTDYSNNKFCSAVKKGNIYGCQFHPEKSANLGLKIIKNFIEIVGKN